MALQLQRDIPTIHFANSPLYDAADSRACVNVSLTPWLTGAGSRRLEGTNIGHENAEGMAYVGVRVEPTVRLGREVEDG